MTVGTKAATRDQRLSPIVNASQVFRGQAGAAIPIRGCPCRQAAGMSADWCPAGGTDHLHTNARHVSVLAGCLAVTLVLGVPPAMVCYDHVSHDWWRTAKLAGAPLHVAGPADRGRRCDMAGVRSAI
jgi:hypothetical protein